MHSRKPDLAGQVAVTIGIDPHRGSHTAAALNPERQVLAEVRVPATRAGYRPLPLAPSTAQRRQGQLAAQARSWR